jgi:hypothetical protein
MPAAPPVTTTTFPAMSSDISELPFDTTVSASYSFDQLVRRNLHGLWDREP